MIMKTNPDLVLMDVIMPKLDGISVMERVKKERAGKPMPSFIMVTAAGSEQVASDAFQMGACYYIMKPFNREVVMDKIRRVCGEGGSLLGGELKQVIPISWSSLVTSCSKFFLMYSSLSTYGFTCFNFNSTALDICYSTKVWKSSYST